MTTPIGHGDRMRCIYLIGSDRSMTMIPTRMKLKNIKGGGGELQIIRVSRAE